MRNTSKIVILNGYPLTFPFASALSKKSLCSHPIPFKKQTLLFLCI